MRACIVCIYIYTFTVFCVFDCVHVLYIYIHTYILNICVLLLYDAEGENKIMRKRGCWEMLGKLNIYIKDDEQIRSKTP